ncbi:hypothetical protein JOC78_001632 [Bacillus ectoiniformans]|nr:hypothetical protein [Bacillus ectoiniformans]MBM7648686.1 hypothetical protein [Bacillus ectoiniformans]
MTEEQQKLLAIMEQAYEKGQKQETQVAHIMELIKTQLGSVLSTQK